ncbi:MAG: 4-phosphoerythronate dehydrogenase [Fibrobacterota bacterium]
MKIVADENIPYVEEVFSHLGEVTLLHGRKITPASVADAQALLVRSVTQVNEELLGKSKVRFVGTATIGFDHVAVDYLKKKGIAFASAPGSNATSVAEYVVSSLLTLGKKVGFKLADKSIGIVGCGNVGSRVAFRCAALGMKTVLNDPLLFEQTHDAKYRLLDEALACDIVTFHVPLTKSGPLATYHLLNEALLGRTKKGVVLFNTSRGSVAETLALHRFLDAGHFAATVFDVFENEPEIDITLAQKADIVTPHIAGYSFDGKVRGTEMIYRALIDHFKLESRWRLTLPPPPMPKVLLSGRGNADDKLREAVSKVYNVMDDDARLRDTFECEPYERPVLFDRLRKEYPVRREFANTRVVLPAPDPAFEARLKALDFVVDIGS